MSLANIRERVNFVGVEWDAPSLRAGDPIFEVGDVLLRLNNMMYQLVNQGLLLFVYTLQMLELVLNVCLGSE